MPTPNSAKTSKAFGRFAALFLILSVWLPLLSEAAEEIADGVWVAPPPAWAESKEDFTPGDSPPYAEGGIFYHRTADHFRPDEDSIFSRVVYEFQSKAGLEDNATLSWNVDPEFEEIRLHWIRVYREGRWIDLLPEIDLEVVDARTDVRTWYYDNSKDVRVILEGVQVGDILDYGFTRIGSNPIVKDHFSDSASLGFSVPVGSIDIRLDWPKDRGELQYRTYPTRIPPEIYENDGYEVYQWSIEDSEAVILDSRLPQGYEVLPWVQFSDWPGWGAVAQWAVDLYPLDQELPPLLVKEAGKIEKAGGTPLMKATKALQFIQDVIRYVSIPVGPHSYQPYPPETIAARRYGDCKDKSLLLVLLLRKLGIDADLVLVSTDDRQLLRRRLPTQAAFDHVLVQAIIEGETIWMDPTDSHEGGVLPMRYFSDFGYGLVISPDTTDLAADVGPQGRDGALASTTESFYFEDFAKPVKLIVDSIYEGRNADNLRWDLATDGLDSFARAYTNYYASLYDVIPEAQPLAVEDEREMNQVRIVEEYGLPTLFPPEEDSETTVCNFSAQIVADQIPEPSEKIRSGPFALPRPLHQIQTIEIHLPDDSDFGAEDFSMENQWFRYDFSVSQNERVLRIHHDFEILSDFVLLEDIDAYQKKVDEMKDYLDYYIEVNLGDSGPEKPPGFLKSLGIAFSQPASDSGASDDSSEGTGQAAGPDSGASLEKGVSRAEALGFSVVSFFAGVAWAAFLWRRKS